MEEGLLADVTGLSTPSLLQENEDLTHVLDVLCAGGYGAWVVGGAVRDSLLGKIPHEYDICTTATPDEVIESFDDTIPTGVKFGTVTVKSGTSMFEVTTLRTETGYGDGRRPDVVEWGDSLLTDLSRRDFTINAMAYDLARELLHDPFGGKRDLENKCLRAVGNANQRLSEDGLRILRAYRFMDRQENGIWQPENELSIALVENRAMLAMVSIERVWSELARIITGKNASKVLSRMNDDGILAAIFGYPLHSEVFDLVSRVPEDLEARFALISSKINQNDLTIILERLKVSKSTFNRTKFLHSLLGKLPNQNELRLYRYTLGTEVITHSSMLSALGDNTDLINKSLNYPSKIDCLVNGEWIMHRTGLSPGIKLGRLKDWLFRIQIERGYENIEQMETALCTIPWQNGDPKSWPRPNWP
jgi:tRNA nucleotidyltransferase (CCA-adding enzyme)